MLGLASPVASGEPRVQMGVGHIMNFISGLKGEYAGITGFFADKAPNF